MTHDSCSNHSFSVSEQAVSALFHSNAECMHGLVFAHGAGAGMSHSFMVRMADALLDEDIATLRYQFPYMEYGKRIPDRQPKLLDTVRAAVECFGEIAPDMKCVAGGKSMGGRMTSLAVSKGLVPRVTAIAFFGFPLHPPKKPGTEQAKHLAEVDVPMMFVQGTRDKLAPKDLLQPIIDDLDKAVVDWIPTADHGFKVLKSAELTEDGVTRRIASSVAQWIKQL